MPVKHLFLLRHGEAQHSYPDELRELTEEGRKEVTENLNKVSDRIPPVSYTHLTLPTILLV